MRTHQKAVLVTTGPGQTHGLDDLNISLSRGWRVVHVSPLGGAGTGGAGEAAALHVGALVIIERPEETGIDLLEHAEEEVEELLDEISSGDGANADVAGDLDEDATR